MLGLVVSGTDEGETVRKVNECPVVQWPFTAQLRILSHVAHAHSSNDTCNAVISVVLILHHLERSCFYHLPC